MTTNISRRGFIAASAAMAASTALPRLAFGQAAPLALTATTRVLEVNGRAATVLGLVNSAGKSGLILEPDQTFRVDLTNSLAEETIIHWHGQIPPVAQDGVPDMPLPKLKIGETRSYDYAPRQGTHWMHSHVETQLVGMMTGPLIVRSAADVAADRQEVVLVLNDFAFLPPAEVLATIASGTEMPGMDMGGGMEGMDMGGGMAGMDMGGGMAGMDMGGDMAGMDMGGDMAGMDMSGGMAGMDMSGGMAGMAIDLNDFNFDAYLANDRTLADPEVVSVDKGGRVLLRVINAAAATVFWIDTGALPGRLIAVDGEAVQPMPGSRFGIAMGQRLDIEVDVAAEGGAFPVLALREGARERTGVILATAGASVARVAEMSDADHPAFSADLTQEGALRALTPLAVRPADSTPMLMLGGTMQPYRWTINDRTWEERIPVTAKSGQRVEITFHNMSMMAHPMHLHGHAFQVVAINGKRFAGAVRDTVHVPPMAMLTVAVDAGEAAQWMLHCHHSPHLWAGMITEFAVSA